MSPQFPPLKALPPITLNPGSPRPAAARAAPPRLLARLVVTVAGVGGFLGLLVAAVYAPSAQEGLRIAAFIWFLGFGAVRVILDLRASGRPGVRVAIHHAGERDRRMAGGRR